MSRAARQVFRNRIEGSRDGHNQDLLVPGRKWVAGYKYSYKLQYMVSYSRLVLRCPILLTARSMSLTLFDYSSSLVSLFPRSPS